MASAAAFLAASASAAFAALASAAAFLADEASLAQGAKVLLLAAEAPPNLGRRYTTLFRESYSQLANGDNVVALPFIVESIFLSSELMQSDQTHPNASAQPLLLDVVWPTLSSLIGMTDRE